MASIASVPQPNTLPILGNLHQIPKGGLYRHLLDLGRRYDEGIFKLKFGSRISWFVTGAAIVEELSDETRFRKVPGPGLRAVRAFAGDGLFTAFSEEANWGKAHRILLPAFSQRSMRGYFDMILGVCDQLVAKWERHQGEDILVADDMTRLTLDSIAVAGFGHDFHSFEKPELDPFLVALGRALEETMDRLTRLPIQQRFAKKQQRQLADDIATMNALVDGIIAERRAHPKPEARDLLNLMLTAVDPDSGEALDDINIRFQVITFLIAGHETTSGLLTFACHLLLRHPHVLAQAYAEADRVLPGDTRPDYGHLVHLDVIERVIKEAQRLWPTAPIYSVGAYKDELVAGKYLFRKDRSVAIFTPGLHRDPKVWERPDDFDIDRWLPEQERTRNPHAYKPFGSGARACIGRQFALVEAKLALAMILRRFALSDPGSYKLEIKETLSIKPDEFYMRVRVRAPHERLNMGAPVVLDAGDTPVAKVAGAGQRLAVLYGTSLGTARDIAEEIASKAEGDGFEASVFAMDEALERGNAPEDRVIVAVTATYNGKAPDSALKVEKAIIDGHFGKLEWSKSRFAVLGIGNSQWPGYQAFPKLVDATFEANGAQRLVPRGEADGDGDFDGAVSGFLRDLWNALGSTAGEAEVAGLDLQFVDTATARATALPAHAVQFEVLANEELVRPADGLWDFALEPPRGSTRLVTLRLPEGATYATGDHVAVYARNRPELVEAALARLGVAGDALLVAASTSSRFKHLPLGATLTARALLSDFVDLQDPASRKAIERLAALSGYPDTAELTRLAGEAYQSEVADRRLTVLDILALHTTLRPSLGLFVELVAAISPRFYSIASSPKVAATQVDLLVGTLLSPAWSGIGEHKGFASTYLRDVAPGDRLFGYVRRPNPPFAPPADASVPMILVGPGTGFAPLRGFLQERAAKPGAAKSQLFFGCRHPDHDWFCRTEMEAWRDGGLIDLHLAFSAVPSHPWRFVQDALLAEEDAVWSALDAGAQIFVCGDGRFMAPAVRDTLIEIHEHKTGATRGTSSAWLQALIDGGRYHQDVFGFGK